MTLPSVLGFNPRSLDELAKFDLPIRITEYNFPGQRSKYYTGDRTAKLTPEEEKAKAEALTQFYRICFAHPAVTGIMMWGFWEGANWIPQSSLYKRDWTPTPAAGAYRELVLNKWWTRWILQAAQPDAGRHTFTAKLSRTLGELCVLPDNEPPTLSRLRVLPRRGKVYVAFRYYDNLSGVDTDEIKMYIDGNPAIPEIDGEHHQVSYQAEEQLPRGKHSLRITTKDQIGNKTELSRTFTVR